MTSEKLIEVFARYKLDLAIRKVEPNQIEEYTQTGESLGKDASLAHLAWMCSEATAMVKDGRKEKAFRWLGFIQGVLFSEGIFSLDDLKNHSRPT